MDLVDRRDCDGELSRRARSAIEFTVRAQTDFFFYPSMQFYDLAKTEISSSMTLRSRRRELLGMTLSPALVLEMFD